MGTTNQHCAINWSQSENTTQAECKAWIIARVVAYRKGGYYMYFTYYCSQLCQLILHDHTHVRVAILLITPQVERKNKVMNESNEC